MAVYPEEGGMGSLGAVTAWKYIRIERREPSFDTNLGNGNPSSSTRGTICARRLTSDNTRGRYCKENKKSGSQKQCNGGTKKLRGELNVGLGSKEVAGRKVTSHVSGLTGGTAGDGTSNEVHPLRRGFTFATALGETTENHLRGLGNHRGGVNVGITGRLHANEREDEGKEEGENPLAAGHSNQIKASSHNRRGRLTVQR
jgi:hypothetical protein